jgi:POT family proton-dependent oligopeptide transporter
MAKREYLTAPLPSTKMPPAVPYILANETAERLAFYGMTSILVIFMTDYLVGPDGALSAMSNERANEWFHWFNAAVYFLAIVGAVISDVWLGKFKTIVPFCVVYCVGFAVLTFNHTTLGLIGGLGLIAIGSGIIKPCVTANVGDQFGASNKHLIERVYSWFYFAINLGATISMFGCPALLAKWGPTVGFGVPGVFMVVATLAYWLGRYHFVHIPPAGKAGWIQALDREGLKTVGRIGAIFVFVAMFFALFYQSQSAWVLQAKNMKLQWLWITWEPAQMQAANPFLILIAIPLFSYWIYPALSRVWTMTPLRKIGIGMFITAASFLISVWIERQIAAGVKPSIGWQFLAYVFLTAAEVMVSVTALEFAYKQAPNRMKSLIQSVNLLSISLGNIFAAIVNAVIQNPDGTSKLPGASYYWFFTGAMLVTAILFIPLALRYKAKEYIQDEAPASN